MMSVKSSLLILILVMCIGCDPARILIIDAGKKPGGKVMVYTNKSIYPQHYGRSEGNLVVEVPPQDSLSQHLQRFYYGFGYWSTEEVSSFSSGIDSIVFTEPGRLRSLSNFEEMKTYLLH